jgi:tRNA 2-selenouridine synthase
MVGKLAPLKPLVGGEELSRWQALAGEGRTDELFERVMVAHYDPCYDRSTRKSYAHAQQAVQLALASLQPDDLVSVARELAAREEGRPG